MMKLKKKWSVARPNTRRDTASGSALVYGSAIGCAAVVGTSLMMTQGALAQDARETARGPDEIVVSGSRILRDGYEAPTPVTVVSEDFLQTNTASANIADTLNNTFPSLANSASPAGSVQGASAASQGMNVLSLRGMGGNRTLTLFDGQRSVPAMFDGAVDINNFPQQLIQRVETVTGGASAVYGSDAVAGVVNLILDKDFTGFKTDVSVGQTTYGDDESFRAALSGGFEFSDGRGHVLLSGETAKRSGVSPGAGSRDWDTGGWGVLVNPGYTPTNGQPQYLVRPEVALSNAHPGGVIVSGPLRGTAFGSGGNPFQLNYGEIVNDPWMVGGAWRETEIRRDLSGTLEPENQRNNVFARVSYDVTDSVNVFVQAAWGDNKTFTPMWPAFQAGNGPTILSGNPFIPADVQARMNQLGLASFRIGSMNREQGTILNDVNRETMRYVIGAEGELQAFARTWSWDTYFQYGKSTSTTDISNLLNTTRYALAVDAVVNPNTGATVCRIVLTSPTSNCVPFNPLGFDNGNSRAARDYILGTSTVEQSIQQSVVAATLTGEVFSTWAGPVSMAFNTEFREETAKGRPSASLPGSWFAGNFSSFDGENDVAEAAVEALIPLASGLPGAESLDLNAAYRFTDYKFSGNVSTWKIGAVWSPVSDWRIRSTLSRDIRAPNFNEILAVASSGFRSAFDPFTNTTPQFMGQNSGNPDLDPEEGETFEVGVIYQPAGLPGFSLALDYWDIELNGAIASPSDNDTLRFCFIGRQEFCSRIQRNSAGVVTLVNLSPINLASVRRSGLDIDATHRLDLGPGQLGLRLLGTYYLNATADEGRGDGEFSVLKNVGTGGAGSGDVGVPLWRLTANVDYSVNETTASLTARAQSSGLLNAEWIECTSGCPASSALKRTIENNHVDSAFYLDASVSQTLNFQGGELDFYFNVRNLLNSDPAIMPQGPVNFTYVMNLARQGRGYDVLGRQYLLGFRYRL